MKTNGFCALLIALLLVGFPFFLCYVSAAPSQTRRIMEVVNDQQLKLKGGHLNVKHFDENTIGSNDYPDPGPNPDHDPTKPPTPPAPLV